MSLNQKARELKKRERPGEIKHGQCEIQPVPQANMCSLQDIELSSIYSLCNNNKHSNSSAVAVYHGSEQVPLVKKPTDPNDYKPLNELDLECISIEDDVVSISSNESSDIMEVGAWIPKNVQSTKNSKGKNHYNPSSALTDKCGVSDKPKLYVSQTVSSPLSKLETPTICVKTTAKVDCVNTHPLCTAEAALSPPNKTRRVLDVTQTLSTSSSRRNNGVETIIHFQQDKLPKAKTSSIDDPKKTRIEISSRNADLQTKSSSSVGDSEVPSDIQTEQKPLENVGSKSSPKKFCCAPSWLASMYGEQFKCSCTFAAGPSSSVSQPGLEGESYKDDVTLLKNLDNVEKATTSTSGAKPADKIEKAPNVEQSHRTLNCLKNDRQKNSIPSEQNKLTMNKEKDPFEHPKQLGTLTTESTVHAKCSSSVCYQDTGPEPSKISFLYIDKIRDSIRTDCLFATSGDEVIQDNEIEYNTQHPENKFGSNDNECLTKSEDGGLQGFNDIIPEVREEHSFTSVIEVGNTEQRSQIQPPCDQEYHCSWTDQLSEIITHFPSGMLDKNTIRASKARESAEVNQEHYSKKVIDKCLDNFEDLVKQFEEYDSVLSNDRHNPVLHSVMPSGNPSSDKIPEKIDNNTSSKEFCCLLNWSASICGEQCKCSCTFGPNTTKPGGDEIMCSYISQQSGNKFPVTKGTKRSTVKKGIRSDDRPSRPQMKTQGQPMQKVSINSGEKCESASGLNNSPNKGSRKRKTQPTDRLQFQEGIVKSSSLEMGDNTQGLVRCNGSLLYESNTAAGNKQETKKKKGSDIFTKKATTTLTKEARLDLQTRFLPTDNQMGRATGQCHWASRHNSKSKQDRNNQLSRKSKPNETHQSKSQSAAKPQSSKNAGDRAMDDDKVSTVKKSGKKPLKDCEQHKSKNTQNKIQHVRPDRPKLESSKEATQTFASPNLDVNRRQIGRNTRTRKNSLTYKDIEQLHPKKVEQSPEIQRSRNIIVKKGGKDKDVSQKKKLSFTLTTDSGLAIQSKMALYKSGSSSLKNDNFGSSLSKPDNKAAGQMSKKVSRLHPENQHVIANYVTRPKRSKESFVPGHKATRLVEAKSNRALVENISEQTISSKKALEKCSSPLAKVKDLSTCNINKSDREIRPQDIQHLDIHSNEVQKNQAMNDTQNTQVTPKKSVSFDTLENKVNKKTTSIIKRNSKDFNLLPKVRKSAQETYQEIIPKDLDSKSKKHTQNKNQRIPTEGIKTCSVSKTKPHSPVVGTQNISSVETTEAPQPSVHKLKSSIMCDRIKVRSEQDKKNKDHFKKDQVVKTFQNAFVQEGSFCILPEKIPSRGTPLDLEKESVSPVVQTSAQQSKQKCGAEITTVVQETEYCQKLENKHSSYHEGKNQTPGQRKRKANNPGSERGSRRRKYRRLNQNTSCAEMESTSTKESNQDLEQTSGCQLGHVVGVDVSPKSGSSVVREKASSSHLESQKSSYLNNKPNLHSTKQRTETNVTRDKSTCSDRNQSFLIPSDKMKESSSKKVGIEESLKSVDNSQEYLEKMASPTLDTGIKSLETSYSGRPIGQSHPKEKTIARECVLKLFRLPLPLERFLVDNAKSPRKVDGKAEAEQREK